MIATENINIDNINFLTERFPHVWEIIKRYRPGEKPEYRFNVVKAKSGALTLTVDQGDKTIYIHSKYDPVQEAERLVAQFKVATKYRQIFFYGAGLGYHIEAFAKRYPDLQFTIYEPHPEIFALYLAHRSLQTLPPKSLKNIHLETGVQESLCFLTDFINFSTGEVLFVPLPSYERIFSRQYQWFTGVFQQLLTGKRVSLITNYAYEKRWVINSLKNFPEVLNTPNIIHEKKQYFAGKPALIVAAGPSLDEEIENIRYIKENGLAYIFSVGSAVNALLARGIYPDAACAYDPSALSIRVFERIIKEKIDSIPLVFGSSLAYDVLENYPGPKLHMLISQDPAASFYLRTEKSDNLEILRDAATIATVALQLLYRLGCNPIVFAGQNLAYKEKQLYAGGIKYENVSTYLGEDELKDAYLVEDVCGGEVYTRPNLDRMRKEIEGFIARHPDREYINTTKGGAKINGTEYIPLAEVIAGKFAGRVVEPGWHVGDFAGYDLAYAAEKQKIIEGAIEEFADLLERLERLFRTMDKLIAAKNHAELEKLFVKFDKELKKINRNQFYIAFMKPMKRVELELIAKVIDDIKYEPNAVVKGEKVLETFRKFFTECQQELAVLRPLLLQHIGERLAREEKPAVRV